jgi:hypothetical protein
MVATRVDEPVKVGDLVGELLVASGEAAERYLGGLGGVRDPAGVGSQAGAGVEQGCFLQRLQAFAEVGGCGDDQRLQLTHAVGALVDGAAPDHPQVP